METLFRIINLLACVFVDLFLLCVGIISILSSDSSLHNRNLLIIICTVMLSVNYYITSDVTALTAATSNAWQIMPYKKTKYTFSDLTPPSAVGRLFL
jgi:hypothetical protein